MISKEEKELRVKRHKQFLELLAKYNIKTSKLAFVTGIRENNLSSMKTLKVPITEETFKALMNGITKLIQESDIELPKPNIEVETFDYIKQQLKINGNVMVKKNKIKDFNQYQIDLKLNGFNCSFETDRDGDYIITDNNRHKPVIETFIKPKPEIESDLAVIDKVRKVHEDALVVETIKEVTNAQEVTNWMDNIVITEDDIKEALELNNHVKQLSEKEEIELKEMANALIPKCGLNKESKDDSLMAFLKTNLTNEELKGFIRGISILSVLDEDYQQAAYYIDHFINQGYVEG